VSTNYKLIKVINIHLERLKKIGIATAVAAYNSIIGCILYFNIFDSFKQNEMLFLYIASFL